MSINEDDIPPIKQIRSQLSGFEIRVPVWGLTVFTVDGLIIAQRLFYDAIPENIEWAISALSASLITISQDFIRLVDNRKLFRQVLIESRGTDNKESFSILLRQVAENVLLACIFPDTTQLGLLIFEVDNLSVELLEIVNQWDVLLHDNTVT